MNLLKFPDDLGRVEACLNTIVESWDCEVLGDYNLENTLVALVNHAAEYDTQENLLFQDFYLSLMQALLLHRELVSESD